MNVEQLTSSVIAHAGKQHEDSEWAIVTEGMRRCEIGAVISAAGARTPKQAKRAVRAYLAYVVTDPRLARDGDLVLA